MSRLDAMVARMEAARGREDWPEVVARGEEVLASRPPDAVRARIDTSLGRARFFLGHHEEALRHFEAAFEGRAPESGAEATELAYFAGMAAMIVGDLERSRGLFRRALGPGSAGWAKGAATRGLAQVEIHLGDLDGALDILDGLAGSGGTDAPTLLLRARVLVRQGEDSAARVELVTARNMVAKAADGASSAVLKTVASMFAGMAEVYTELGHPEPAEQLLRECDAALARAGRPRIPAAAYHVLFGAAVRRLEGRLDEADRLLDACADWLEVAGSMKPLVLRERARLAAQRGDDRDATELWSAAAGAFDSLGHRWEAEACRRESRDGPPTARPCPDIAEDMARVWGDVDLPDGLIIVLRLAGDDEVPPDDGEVLLQVAHEIEDLLASSADGEYDGWEMGGNAFTVYCYGDPDALWEVVRPVVERAAERWDAEVTRRREGVETRESLRGEDPA